VDNIFPIVFFVGQKGQATDIMIHAEEILKLKRVVNRLYMKHTGQTLEEMGRKALPSFDQHFICLFYFRKTT
jgi:ATP-dependent protease ClpP protease subunit